MEQPGFEERMRSEARLKRLEERLGRLEKHLNLHAGEPLAAPLPAVSPLPAAAPLPAAVPVVAPVAAPAVATLAPAPRQRQGGSWLGAVAAVCFVLAAGFIIKLSLDSGWLTPERQIGLAIVLGLVLVFSGLALLGADREYASFLPAAGIIVLYAAVFSAHRVYALVPVESAVSLSAMVSGLCVWLYARIRADVYPVTAAVGSYFAPLILGLGAEGAFSLYYYLLCSTGFAVISIWVRSRTLTTVASYLAMMMTAFTGLTLHDNGLVVAMLALNFLVFSGGVYLYTRQHGKALTDSEAVGLLPALLFFYAMEYHFIEAMQPGLAPWLSLAFAAVLLGLHLSAKQRLAAAGAGSGSMVLTFVTVVGFHSFYLELLPGGARPWLFTAAAAAFCLLPASGVARPEMRIPVYGVLAVMLIEYVSMMSHLLSGAGGAWLLVSLASLAGLWAMIYFRDGELSGRQAYSPVLGAAHLLAVAGLYNLTKDAGSLHVSVSWLAYAVGVILVAFSRQDEPMARSAVFVLAFAAAKALLYDAAAAPTLVRIACLLLTGAALYGAGYFLRQIAGWKAPAR